MCASTDVDECSASGITYPMTTERACRRFVRVPLRARQRCRRDVGRTTRARVDQGQSVAPVPDIHLTNSQLDDIDARHYVAHAFDRTRTGSANAYPTGCSAVESQS